MLIDKKIDLINKYFKKKKEMIIMELVIKDYNNSNFYMAIVFNKRLEKFKVAYIPLDVVNSSKIADYICYQFINIKTVNYILESLNSEKDKFEDPSARNNLNENINNFYIEISINLAEKVYKFKTTKYLPKKWIYLFDPIVIIFEHIPNIMSELCTEILSVITDSNVSIDYKSSLNFDLFNDNIDDLFEKTICKQGLEYYNNSEVKFVENVNGKYFAIVKDHLVIIEYNSKQKVLNLYCDCKSHVPGKHIYAALMAIRNKEVKEFYKIMVVDKKEDFAKENQRAKYYLCFGTEKDTLNVIEASAKKKLPISIFENKTAKIIYDIDDKLKKSVTKILKQHHSDKIDNIMSQR